MSTLQKIRSILEPNNPYLEELFKDVITVDKQDWHSTRRTADTVTATSNPRN